MRFMQVPAGHLEVGMQVAFRGYYARIIEVSREADFDSNSPDTIHLRAIYENRPYSMCFKSNTFVDILSDIVPVDVKDLKFGDVVEGLSVYSVTEFINRVEITLSIGRTRSFELGVKISQERPVMHIEPKEEEVKPELSNIVAVAVEKDDKWEYVPVSELVVGDTIIYNIGEPESVVTNWYQYSPRYNVKLGLNGTEIGKVDPSKVVKRIKRSHMETLNMQLAVEAAAKLSDLLKQQHAIKSSPNDMVDLTGGWGMISKDIALRAVKDAVKAQLAEITKLIK